MNIMREQIVIIFNGRPTNNCTSADGNKMNAIAEVMNRYDDSHLTFSSLLKKTQLITKYARHLNTTKRREYHNTFMAKPRLPASPKFEKTDGF